METSYFIKQSVLKVISKIIILPFLLITTIIFFLQIYIKENYYFVMFILFYFMFLPYFYWFYSVSNYLYKKKNQYFHIRFNNLKFSLLLNILTILNFILFGIYVFNSLLKSEEPNTKILFIFLFFQLIGLISFLYSSYFICKLVATIEYNRNVKLIDFVGNLFFLSYPPLAIWFIHNKINKSLLPSVSNTRRILN